MIAKFGIVVAGDEDDLDARAHPLGQQAENKIVVRRPTPKVITLNDVPHEVHFVGSVLQKELVETFGLAVGGSQVEVRQEE
jgi:hypothetical protein